MLLIVTLVLTATAAGGMFSNAYTAIIKVAVIGVAAVALLVAYGLTIPEGMGPFNLEQLTRPESGAVINWATLISLGIGDIVAIDFMQRIFSAFVTASGAVLATSAVAARNVLGARQERTPDGLDRLLRATRIAFLPVAALGVLFALRVPQTGILLTLAFDHADAAGVSARAG